MQTPEPGVVEAWSALLVAQRHLTGLLDDDLRRCCGMTLDRYDVLVQLRLAGRPLRMSQLAARVLISRAGVSRLADQLVAEGWVRRWHDEDDRRVVLLELTGEGVRRQRRAARIHLDGLARLVGGPLADRDVGALTEALRALGGGPGSGGSGFQER